MTINRAFWQGNGLRLVAVGAALALLARPQILSSDAGGPRPDGQVSVTRAGHVDLLAVAPSKTGAAGECRDRHCHQPVVPFATSADAVLATRRDSVCCELHSEGTRPFDRCTTLCRWLI